MRTAVLGPATRRILLSVVLLAAVWFGFTALSAARADREVRSLLPPEIGIRGRPILSHTARDWMHGCQLRVWALQDETATKLRAEGRTWLDRLSFDRHPTINTARNYRADPWQEVAQSAARNPIGSLNLDCHGFDRHRLVQVFGDDTRAYFHRIGGESHMGFVLYPDSRRILIIVSVS